MKLGDLNRWRPWAPDDDGVVMSFTCPARGRQCRFALVTAGDVTLYLTDGRQIWPLGCFSGDEGVHEVEFTADRDVDVVAVLSDCPPLMYRRYDDNHVSENDKDSLTSYNPSNFVETDVDRLQRLMMSNQARMLSALEAKYNHHIAALEARLGKDKTHGTTPPPQRPQKRATPQPPSDAATPPGTGKTPRKASRKPSQDAVKSDD